MSSVIWQRLTPGLHGPLGMAIRDDQASVFGQGQITRLHDLNGDDTADYYENFSNVFIQAANTRDFAMDMDSAQGRELDHRDGLS